MNEELFARLKKVIAEELSQSEDKIVPEASFKNDLGADSLDTVELVLALEEEFKIEIPDDESQKIQTVQDALTYIEQHAE